MSPRRSSPETTKPLVKSANSRSTKKTKRCGDFGGKTHTGNRCGRRVKKGKCPLHDDAAELELAEKKVAFLEEYRTGICSLKTAAKKAGASKVTVWRWRQEDQLFDDALGAIQENIDEIRLTLVEDSLVTRCLRKDAPAALVIFYLVNRGKGRWRHIQHIQQQTVHMDLSNFTEEELQRVIAGEDPVRIISERIAPPQRLGLLTEGASEV